jgi:anti-sigma factor RsiW
MLVRKLTCRELDDFLAAWLDDELPADVCRAFQLHLSVCPACVAYLDGYREAVRLGRLACRSELEAAVDAPRELVDAILALRRA